MVTVVNVIKGTLGPCWPTAETFNYSPDPAATGIAVFVGTITGALNLTVGMEYGSGNFMDPQESATIGSDAHMEVWTLAFPGPANPTTIKFLANGSALTDAMFAIVEFSGNDPERTTLVGFTGFSIGANQVEITTPWTAESGLSVMLDAFQMKGKSKMTPGSGQTHLFKQLTTGGRAEGSSEPATGTGPAVWTIGATTNRRYAHVVLEIKALVVTHTGNGFLQAAPVVFDGVGDVEHDGEMDIVIGNPATLDGVGDVEHKGDATMQVPPITFTGEGDVEHEGTGDLQADPAGFNGAGNNNTEHFGNGFLQAGPASLTAGTGDVEHKGDATMQAAPVVFTGVGDALKSGGGSFQAAPVVFDGVGDVEHGGAMDPPVIIATSNFRGDVEHDGLMAAPTIVATLRGTGTIGSDTPGFDVASRNFVVTINAQYTAIRAQIIETGAAAAIQIPIDGHSVVIRKLT